MTTEDKSQMPLFSPEDEKEAQKAPDHHSTNGTLKATNKWTGFQGKTLWDWLQLLGILAIPLVVAGATLLFSIQQANLANQQHEADKLSALNQQQAVILQTYIDNIQDLLLNHNLLKSGPQQYNPSNNYAATLARARTLTALQGLDQERKSLLVEFLYEANLLELQNCIGNPIGNWAIIDLSSANLRGVDLSGVYLTCADFAGANLTGANFTGATLNGVKFSGANLTDANFTGATLHGGAEFTGTHLDGAHLNGADLNGAYLSDAHLNGAHLNGAYLSDAYLHGAHLDGANLTGAHLDGAILSQQQLDQVHSCDMASLPPGLTCHHPPPLPG